MSIENRFTKIINEISGKTNTPFDIFLEGIINSYIENSDIHTLKDLKTNTKVKGDLFELFCKKYLSIILKYDKVWLLNEIPPDIREQLGLGERDLGIDLVVYNSKTNKYSAVQSKFKKSRSGLVPGTWIPYNCVNWSQLSTFYSLCSRTNNNDWEKCIVMTNAKYVRRMGMKKSTDMSICYAKFKKLSNIDFLSFISTPQKIEEKSDKLSLEELRKKRIEKFSNI